jgi:energy-coupling factor transporter ATP-binding protein EcfA2
MSLKNTVSVSQRFQRAVRIDLDLDEPNALNGFVCPQSSSEVLTSMSAHIQQSGQAAFTWTGPYGSGKSTLAVALAALLSTDESKRNTAASLIGDDISKAVWTALPVNNYDWCIVPVVGRRENPTQAIGQAIEGTKLSRKKKTWAEKDILNVIETNLANDGNRILLFIDEMGKFLEAAAFGDGDVYIFQQLAELASRSKGRFVIVGVLHQAFAEYGKRLSKELRDEWTKIQGRFIDLSVNASGEEQIELLSQAIQSKATPQTYEPIAKTIFQSIKARRQNVSFSMEIALANCWPLHPVTACLLGPISKRRFGQNQRSIFGFLNSAEPNGFQDFLKSASKADIYTPDILWDYLRQNLEPAILASPDGHRWSIAVEAVERSESFGAEMTDLKVLKTLALIDLFKESSGLVPSTQILYSSIHASPKEITESLTRLKQWSVIIYRNFLDAYAVFAGSDFDIEDAVEKALLEIGVIDCQLLTELAGLHPILAKRYYHEVGTLRWFDVELAPLTGIDDIASIFEPEKGTIGKFLFAIPTENEKEEDAQTLCKQLSQKYLDRNIIIGLSESSWGLQNRAKELVALEYVSENSPELAGDSVARREVNARLASQKEVLETELHKALEAARWFHSGKNGETLKYSELNSLASNLSQKTYPEAPIIKNELINRHKASSSAVAAQNTLLKLMVSHTHKARLGLNRSSAESGLYSSILFATQLHNQVDGAWDFRKPIDGEDPYNLFPLWDITEQYLVENSERSVSLGELYSLWRGRPFGIRDGLMPILAVAFILSTKKNVALYRENIYQSSFKSLDVEYLTIDPESIQLRWVNLSENSRALLSGMADIVKELSPQHSSLELSPIEVARGLISVFDGIHPWTLRTSHLSQNAKNLREIFKKAHDPNQLIFNDLPAFTDKPASSDTFSNEGIKQVILDVSDGLKELTTAHPNMLQELYRIMLGELGVPNTSKKSLQDLNKRAENIKGIAGDFKLDAFAGRFTTFKGEESEISGIASLVVSKPLNNWIDTDVDRAKIEIAKLAQKFNQAEAFAHVKGRTNNRKSIAVVVGQDGQNDTLHSEFNLSVQEQKQVQVLSHKFAKFIEEDGNYSKSVILGALAELFTQNIDDEIASNQDQ